jgi:hypothetical protein
MPDTQHEAAIGDGIERRAVLAMVGEAYRARGFENVQERAEGLLAAYDAARSGEREDAPVWVLECDSIDGSSFATIDGPRCSKGSRITVIEHRAARSGEAEGFEQQVNALIESLRAEGDTTSATVWGNREAIARALRAALAEHPEPRQEGEREIPTLGCRRDTQTLLSLEFGAAVYGEAARDRGDMACLRKWAQAVELLLARHPHQDVERLTNERDDARRFHTAEHTDRVDAEAEVERLRGAISTHRRETEGTAGLGEEMSFEEIDRRLWVLAPSPDDPTQLGSEESAPNTTAGKLGSRFPTPQTQAMCDAVESASPDDRPSAARDPRIPNDVVKRAAKAGETEPPDWYAGRPGRGSGPASPDDREPGKGIKDSGDAIKESSAPDDRGGVRQPDPPFKTLDAQLMECEEALRAVGQEYAEFREQMLAPIKGTEGASIESMSWDDLLSVAARSVTELKRTRETLALIDALGRDDHATPKELAGHARSGLRLAADQSRETP